MYIIYNIILYLLCSTLSDHSESAFYVIAPKYWNALPYDIRCLASLSLFKCKLSTNLLTL